MLPYELVSNVSSYMENKNLRYLNLFCHEQIILEEKSNYWYEKYGNFFITNNIHIPIFDRKYSLHWKNEYLRVKCYKYWHLFNNLDIGTKKISICFENIKKIPKEICKFINVNELYFCSNKLQKLPRELKEMVNIENVYLSQNNFKKIPKVISYFSKLERLYMSYNNITSISSKITKNTKLRELFLCSNKIQYVPKFMTKLTSLEELWLFNNKITAVPKFINIMKKLKILNTDIIDHDAKSFFCSIIQNNYMQFYRIN